MGKTSTESKRKYNEKTYDRISLTVKKGMKEVYMEQAKEKSFDSLNSYINYLLNKDKEESPD